jgi:putative FmdB family regulatory protein
MPTYEYACRSCGEHLEVVQSFKDDPLTECPGCKGQLRKVYSAAGLIFKGSGWHVKDYAGSSSGSSKGDGPSSTKESKSTDTTASKDTGSTSTSSSDKAASA